MRRFDITQKIFLLKKSVKCYKLSYLNGGNMKKLFIMFIIAITSTVFINDCKKNEVVDNSGDKQEELVVGISYGNIATNFSEKDISGATFNLNDYKGKVIMLSFSAMWCGPCRREAGELMELYEV